MNIVFERYPDLLKAYNLVDELRKIYNQKHEIEIARLELARWYNKIVNVKLPKFATLSKTIELHADNILNHFLHRSTNASAEAFNSKILTFRARVRGVVDIPFFLFRLCNFWG